MCSSDLYGAELARLASMYTADSNRATGMYSADSNRMADMYSADVSSNNALLAMLANLAGLFNTSAQTSRSITQSGGGSFNIGSGGGGGTSISGGESGSTSSTGTGNTQVNWGEFRPTGGNSALTSLLSSLSNGNKSTGISF